LAKKKKKKLHHSTPMWSRKSKIAIEKQLAVLKDRSASTSLQDQIESDDR